MISPDRLIQNESNCYCSHMHLVPCGNVGCSNLLVVYLQVCELLCVCLIIAD